MIAQSGDFLLDVVLFDVRVTLAFRDGIALGAVSLNDIADYIAEHWNEPRMREHARFIVLNQIDREFVTDEEVQEILADDESLCSVLMDYYEATAEQAEADGELFDQVRAVMRESTH